MNRQPINEKDWLFSFQQDRLIEELSELIQAIMKVKRYKGDKRRLQNLFEEMSHVKICMKIYESILEEGGIDIKKEINNELDLKLFQLMSSYKKEIEDAGKD